MTRHKHRTINLKSIYQWHRYVGVTIALFVLILSSTGIILNHTSEFKLSNIYVKNETLLNHYGIHAPDSVKSYVINNIWVSQWQNRLYLNKIDLGETNSQLVGVIYYQEMIIIGLNDSLLLYTPEGELIEKLSDTEGIPAAISAIGITDNHLLAVNSTNGIYTADIDLSIWLKDPQAITIWNDSKKLPQRLYEDLLNKYRGKGLSIERVLLDIHSGRLLSTGGIYFMDVVALLLMFLACSGLWIWFIRILNQNKRKKIIK